MTGSQQTDSKQSHSVASKSSQPSFSVLSVFGIPKHLLNRFVNRFIKARMRKFFSQRAPRQDSIKLGLRNVYIFFSRQGLLFALLLVITFIAGINYANNLVLGLCFYLASIWLISVHLTFAHVSGLRIKLLDVTMAEVDSPVWVTVQIDNPSAQPSRQLTLGFDHSDYFEELGVKERGFEERDVKEQGIGSSEIDNTTTTNAPPFVYKQTITSLQDSLIVRLPMMTHKRGRLVLPRLVIESVYPLGVMRSWSYAYFAKHAWVYPKPLAFEWQTQHHMVGDEDTEHSSNYRQGQNDFDKLDEYQEGESLARVSWAHVARGQGMLTKHFVDPTGHELLLDYADMPASHHEQKLQQLAFAIQNLQHQGDVFAVNLPNDHGNLGSGQAFITETLLRLAKAP